MVGAYQIRCPLREAGTVGKHQVGLICPQGRLTFYEYDQAVSATAQKLRDAGVMPGDRLGLAVPLGWEQPILFFAALRVGATVCLNDAAQTPEDLEKDWGSIMCNKIIARLPASGTDRRHIGVSDVLDMSLPLSEDGLQLTFEGTAPATITFTGSASNRRAILHSFGSHYYAALSSNVNVNLRTNDRWLIRRSMHEMESLATVFRCVVSGATLVVGEQSRTAVDAILDAGITHAHLTESELAELVGCGRVGECRLKAAMVKVPVSEALLNEAHRAGIRVHTFYSIPEMASEVTAISLLSPRPKMRTMGQAMRYCDVRINGEGRIQVRGRAMFDGYVEGEKVLSALDSDGWFTTQDFGSLDSEGYLTLQRRAG